MNFGMLVPGRGDEVCPPAVGEHYALLRKIGPAILWLGAMLASLLTLDRLFTGF